MHRRAFLRSTLAAAASGGLLRARLPAASPPGVPDSAGRCEAFLAPIPAYSVTPIVGDGKWVWTEPPKDARGYLEPRRFDVTIAVELEGTGNATQIKATTVAPVTQPEQAIEDHQVDAEGCEAQVRQVAPAAGQLFLAAPAIAKGQTIRAAVRYQVTLRKDYRGFAKDQFPARQKPGREERAHLGDSPGIQTRDPAVGAIVRKLVGNIAHPWDQAQAFYHWVWENIRARRGPYTSVLAALRDRVGDCEERAAVFVAFCRAADIPARLVWIPNHNWAEISLHDESNRAVWIPVHTASYSWFGWTGAHELVLQKGDRLHVPENGRPQRLLADWMQWHGSRPRVRYRAEIKPLASQPGEDAGPGHRRKDERGEWVMVGDHRLDRYLRDGGAAAKGSRETSRSAPGK